VIGFLGHHPPAGPHGLFHPGQDDGRLDDMHEQEPTECQVDRLGQQKVFTRLGDGQDLAEGRRRRSGLVACGRVAVDGVDTSVAAHDLGQSHRDVASAGADVDASPPRADPQALEGGGEGAAVDVVTQGVGHWWQTLSPPQRL